MRNIEEWSIATDVGPWTVAVLSITVLSAFLFGICGTNSKKTSPKKIDLKTTEQWNAALDPPEGPTISEFLERSKGTTRLDERGMEFCATKMSDAYMEWKAKFGKIFVIKSPLPGFLPDAFFVADAVAAKELIVKQNNMYRGDWSFTTRAKGFADALEASLGRSLPSLANVPEWRWRKDAVLREFHKSRMMQDNGRLFFERVVKAGERLCEKLEEAAKSEEPVQVHPFVVEVTVGIIFYFLFGRDLSYDIGELHWGAVYVLEYLRHQIACPFHKFSKLLPFGKCREAERLRDKAWEAMDSVFRKEVDLVVREHRGEVPVASNRAPGSALASLLEREPKFIDQGLDGLIEDIRLLVHAGFETTSNALAFSFGMLAERPDLADKIAMEGEAVIKLQGKSNGSVLIPKSPSFVENATTSKYFFQEAVRLYPPVSVITGEARQDLIFSGDDGAQYRAKKGTLFFFPTIVMQRDQAYIGTMGDRNPKVADPVRWTAPVPEQPFLAAFNLGAHVCPGKPLTQLEGHILLLMAATRFTFELPDKKTDNSKETDLGIYEVSLSRPEDGMRLIVRERN